MIEFVKATCCGSILDKDGLCECERLYVSKYDKCPECGCNTCSYNNPGQDPSISINCTNINCGYIDTQFLSLEDIKEFNNN